MVFHTSADLGPGEHPYACFSAESRPLTSAYIARVRVDRSMNSIEAQGVKTVPGHLLMMRWAEEETANQCSNTKESTGAPVSASEQDSHNRKPLAATTRRDKENKGFLPGDPASMSPTRTGSRSPSTLAHELSATHR